MDVFKVLSGCDPGQVCTKNFRAYFLPLYYYFSVIRLLAE